MRLRCLPSLQAALVLSLSTPASMSSACWSAKSSHPSFRQLFAEMLQRRAIPDQQLHLRHYGSPLESRAGLPELQNSPSLPVILFHTCKLVSVSKNTPTPQNTGTRKNDICAQGYPPGFARNHVPSLLASLSYRHTYTPACSWCVCIIPLLTRKNKRPPQHLPTQHLDPLTTRTTRFRALLLSFPLQARLEDLGSLTCCLQSAEKETSLSLGYAGLGTPHPQQPVQSRHSKGIQGCKEQAETPRYVVPGQKETSPTCAVTSASGAHLILTVQNPQQFRGHTFLAPHRFAFQAGYLLAWEHGTSKMLLLNFTPS